MNIITIGIDLAKNVFAVNGVDENGKAGLVEPKVTRDQLDGRIAMSLVNLGSHCRKMSPNAAYVGIAI